MPKRIEDPLDHLRNEFDALVARMQTPAAKAAGAALFSGAAHNRRPRGFRPAF